MRIERLRQEQPGVDHQNHDGGEARLWDQAAQNLARTALIHRARAKLGVAIRTYLIAGRHKRPAIRAHPSFIH